VPRLKSSSIPRYRKHKASGQAVVSLNSKDHYLGRYGTADSKTLYHSITGRWQANDRQLPNEDQQEEPEQEGEPTPTMNEIILAYLKHATQRYGKSAAELGCLKDALREVKQLCGREPATAFGPKRLRAARQRMIDKGWCRAYVNHQIQRVRRVVKWSVAEEMIPGEVYHRLTAVDGLRHGEPGTRESEPVKPVPEVFIETVKLLVAPQVRTMMELQTLTAMRPSEAATMRTRDLETNGRVWVYRPEHHKTEHHGHKREIYIGPRAQEILRPWLRVNLDEYLFQPKEAVAWKAAERRRDRKTPLWRSHVQAKTREKKGRKRIRFADHYSAKAYAYAIRRACQKAGVPVWGPNRLRHNAATNLRKEYGIELARIILGHSTAFTTEIYAEVDRQQAMEVIGKVG
jgi:integrase